MQRTTLYVFAVAWIAGPFLEAATNDTSGSLLSEIVRSGDASALKKVLREDPACMTRSLSDQGFLPLHLCAFHDRAELAELLRRAQVDASMVAKNGVTAMHVAAVRGATSTAPVLLRAKAPLNAQDHDGNTPLHLAVMYNQPPMVTFLIQSGAAPNPTNNADLTPENIAVRCRNTGMVQVIHTAIDDRWLIEYGANADRVDRKNFREKVDKNGNGIVDSNEVDALHQNWYDTSIKQRDAVTNALLTRYDKDKDGYITYAEVPELLREIRALLDGGEARKLDLLKLYLRECDADGDGYLNVPERLIGMEFRNHAIRYEKFQSTQRIGLALQFQTPDEIRAIGPGGKVREE